MHVLLRGPLAGLLATTAVGCTPLAVPRPTVPSLLASRVTARIQAVPGAEVAVSYRDLATGDSLDLGADVDFHAASTMKIPVMLEVLRSVEAGRIALDQEVLLE